MTDRITENPSRFEYTEPPSVRELEVLQLIANGLTNARAAKQLFITEHTIKFQVAGLLNKLNSKNRTQAVAVALRNGLIDYPEQ